MDALGTTLAEYPLKSREKGDRIKQKKSEAVERRRIELTNGLEKYGLSLDEYEEGRLAHAFINSAWKGGRTSVYQGERMDLDQVVDTYVESHDLLQHSCFPSIYERWEKECHEDYENATYRELSDVQDEAMDILEMVEKELAGQGAGAGRCRCGRRNLQAVVIARWKQMNEI
jgi:hypothetical protein